MTFSWTMDDVKVVVEGGAVVEVKCAYCGKKLPFEQPAYSTHPDDVTIQPQHECKKRKE